MSAVKDAILDAWAHHLSDPAPAATARGWQATLAILRTEYGAELAESEIKAMCREMALTWALQACYSPFVEGADSSFCPDVVELNRIVIPAVQRLGLLAAPVIHQLLDDFGALHRELVPSRYDSGAQ